MQLWCRKTPADKLKPYVVEEKREGKALMRKSMKAARSPSPSLGRYVSQSTIAKLQWSTMLQRLTPGHIFRSPAWLRDTERLWEGVREGLQQEGNREDRQEQGEKTGTPHIWMPPHLFLLYITGKATWGENPLGITGLGEKHAASLG